ncbi:MAG: dTDP-4-amino-4,6-dideoxygalactose transaminase [Desulfobacteraceae bacterium]|nr:MAG: dTDP-4-amino-4,6-dideoxygalactose transaminase [Desulfobacteraceae bacterium]
MTSHPARIPFNLPFIVGNELHYISKAVHEGKLSGDGPYTKKCHAWLESKLACVRAFLTHSCTGALEMAAILCDIRPGDEVIMPSFTFVSTANAFVLRGGVPVFVDIRPDTLNIDEQLIEGAISDRTKAIVPVHYAGVSCAMDKIMAIAHAHKLLVVEDAAQAMLSRKNGKYLGTIGHLGCLSFHETKNIISGEGGALLVNDAQMVERAEIIREKGTNRTQYSMGKIDKYTWVDIGSSFLPSELVGAFLFAQLEQAERIIAARRRIFQLYLTLLRPLEKEGKIRLPFVESEGESNGHIFYIITRTFEERTRIIDHLNQKGVNAVFHYVPLHSSVAGIQYARYCGDMVFTNEMSNRVLRLPLYYTMQDTDVINVVEELTRFFI